MRHLVAVPTVALFISVAPAQAQEANCQVNIQGIVVSANAAHGSPAACAPQVGRPEGTGTGRKVG
jgi:hypothetical protein